MGKDLIGPSAGRVSWTPAASLPWGRQVLGREGKLPGQPRALLTPQWVRYPGVLPALGTPEPSCALGPWELCSRGTTVNASCVPDAW